MNDYSNIEIINFETLNYDDMLTNYPNLYENDMLNFFIEKYKTEYIDTCNDSMLDSLPNSLLNIFHNDSFSSCNTQTISCYSESFQINSNLTMNDETEKSFYSADNRNETKFIISKALSTKKAKSFTCTECKKVYKSKENLTLHHKNIHLKLKPYNCQYCIAVFSHRNGK